MRVLGKATLQRAIFNAGMSLADNLTLPTNISLSVSVGGGILKPILMCGRMLHFSREIGLRE